MVAVGVSTASATPIHDPIVRTRGGGTGSYQIFASDLPYFFDFGAFPTDPDTLPSNAGQGDNCSVSSDGSTVSCDFQNLTGQFISQLTFQGSIPGGEPDQEMQFQDPDGLFTTDPETFIVSSPGSFTAQFAGGGIASGGCSVDGDITFCFGGDFSIDLVGFPLGSNISMLAAAPDAVPEPATLVMLGTGLGLGAALIARRQRKSTRP